MKRYWPGVDRVAVFSCLVVFANPLHAKEHFDLQTATLAGVRQAMDAGALTSESLVGLSLARMRAYESKLNAAILVNPEAVREARMADRELREKGRRSILHGIPILLKDNINTVDLPTTLGFAGLRDARPTADAAIVSRLRELGAIVLAKMNLSELSSGPALSSLGGQTRNPYDLDRSCAGSSGGTAAGLAAGYSLVGLGTDTTGSARWPAATCGIVGLRPTPGRLSYDGIQPNAPTLDAVGVMARSVADAAVVFESLKTTSQSEPDAPSSTRHDPNGLRGARIGFPRNDFSGDDPATDRVMNAAIETFRAAGAEVVEIDIPDWLFRYAEALQAAIVRTESAPSLDAYLWKSFAAPLPRTHAEVLELSESLNSKPSRDITPNPGRLAGYRWEAGGQSLQDREYNVARDEGRSLLREKLREVMSRHRLQAIVYPTQTMPIDRIGSQPRRNARGMFGNFGPVLASLAGWPELTIPAGLTPEGLPVGMSILGTESSEQRLLDLGEAFERSQKRRYPESTPSLAGEKFSY